MLKTVGYAVKSQGSSFEPFSFERRELKPNDVLVTIWYCGICHSDLHQVRNEWGGAFFPMVPGHEIVGIVSRVGSAVKKYQVNDKVGVGCFVDSCRTCVNCKENLEQYCDVHTSFTYNSTEQDLTTQTFGGYSSQIVVDENYVLRLPENLPLEKTAPLLCAGITTYSPLRQFNVRKGHDVGVIGLGGLGHMAVKLAASMGASVTVFSTSSSKEADAKRLGASHFVNSKDAGAMALLANHFDFIIDTVSAPHDLTPYLELLKRDGQMTLVGIPEKAPELQAASLIMRRRKITGSLIGGIRETQEMLDYCGKNNITADIELIPIQQIEAAYARMLKGDVKYRFVIDMNSLDKKE